MKQCTQEHYGNGLVHIYCGHGKGKTTCAMGLCLRAAGAGLKVVIYQFMKDGRAGERRILEKDENVTFLNEARSVSFNFQMNEEQKQQERERYLADLAHIEDYTRHENTDVLLLDEVLYAISCGLLPEQALTDFLDHRPGKLEVILTGREPSAEVMERADYISRIAEEKHPYQKGIPARKGIEY